MPVNVRPLHDRILIKRIEEQETVRGNFKSHSLTVQRHLNFLRHGFLRQQSGLSAQLSALG